MKAWGIFIASGAVLLATSAWTQEKPGLGFKDIYLGMPKETLRPLHERHCIEESPEAYSENEVLRRRDAGWRSKCLEGLQQSQPVLGLPRSYRQVGSIELEDVKVKVLDGKAAAIILEFWNRFAGSISQYENLQAAFIERYGPPKFRDVKKFQNRLGSQFESELLTWKQEDGAITLAEYSGGYIGLGHATIYNRAFEATLQQEERSKVKKDAEGL